MQRSTACAGAVGSRVDDGLRFTEWGAAQRRAIEEGTDVLATAPYAALGDDGCAELRALARPWSKVFADELVR